MFKIAVTLVAASLATAAPFSVAIAEANYMGASKQSAPSIYGTATGTFARGEERYSFESQRRVAQQGQQARSDDGTVNSGDYYTGATRPH